MAISIDELTQNSSFTKAEKGKFTLLPDPTRAKRHFPVISADDHIVEPPWTFTNHIHSRYKDRAPKVVEQTNGTQTWMLEGESLPNVGFNAVAGRPVDEYSFEPTRFDQMRRGAWDISARLGDMDLDGVFASVCFPSFLPGFCGHRIQQLANDPDFALALVRAWNDWHLLEWAAWDPTRIIPLQLPYLLDPEIAATEVRNNAKRGFKAITFSEAPHILGLPSLHTGYWDPLMAACEETETVICIHIGSSGTSPSTAPDAPPDTVGVLFFGYAMFAACDWLYSKIPVRFPNIKICLSEGGIGWVAGLLDRLNHVRKYDSMYGTWDGIDISPADTFRRNFWFCAVDDPSGFALRHVIGVENILVESDYPHADSSWPDTQETLNEQLSDIPPAERDAICWGNAAKLFRHPVPVEVQADPEQFQNAGSSGELLD